MADQQPTPLWPGGVRIPVIGVTGEYQAGKTLFCLTIDPACFDHAARRTTWHWDTEGSATTFRDALNFSHVDLSAAMLEEFPKGHKPVDLFLYWLESMRSIEPGRYRVLAIDTISEIEDGLADWVRAHSEEFGHTKAQYSRMEGIFWGDVKGYWKRILSEVAARCETFAFTSHMKAKWKGNQPTRERMPKGKETLMELASLYLQLERLEKPESAKVPRKPSGITLKSRLAAFDQKAGELIPILPPRLPEATPQAIRDYILDPPNYDRLKAGERAVDAAEMTEDERLQLKANIAENEAVAAQAKLSAMETMRMAAQQQAATMQQPADPGRLVGLAAEAPAIPTKADYSGRMNGACTPEQQERIRNQFQQLGATPNDARVVLQKRDAQTTADLTAAQADELIAKLEQRSADRPF